MILALLFLAAPLKVAMSPLQAGEGVSEKIAAAVTDQVVAEIRRGTTAQVVTQDEIKSTLSLQEQRQMAGCSSDSCIAEVGGALGVDRMVTGSVGKVGESWLVFLKLIDVKKVTTEAQSDRRLRKASLDDVLDAIPGMVKDLFVKMPNSHNEVSAAAAMPTEVATTAAKPAEHAPPPGKDSPFTEKIENPILLGDGAGHFFIFSESGNRTGPLFAGDGNSFYEQRIISSSRNGADSGVSFWDPRFFAGADRSFDHRDGKYSLTCGAKTIALTPSGKFKLANATLRKPRWQRAAVALAVDEVGVYYYIDHTRDAVDDDDFHLFVGKRGHLEFARVDDTPAGAGTRAFLTAVGTLTVLSDPPGATWGAKKLTLMNLDTQAGFVYTKLGVYAGEKLGTACDPYQ